MYYCILFNSMRSEPEKHHQQSRRIHWGPGGRGPTSHYHAKRSEGHPRHWLARWSRSEGQNALQIQSDCCETDGVGVMGRSPWCP